MNYHANKSNKRAGKVVIATKGDNLTSACFFLKSTTLSKMLIYPNVHSE